MSLQREKASLSSTLCRILLFFISSFIRIYILWCLLFSSLRLCICICLVWAHYFYFFCFLPAHFPLSSLLRGYSLILYLRRLRMKLMLFFFFHALLQLFELVSVDVHLTALCNFLSLFSSVWNNLRLIETIKSIYGDFGFFGLQKKHTQLQTQKDAFPTMKKCK